MHGLCSTCRITSAMRTTISRPMPASRRRTSCRNGIICRFTRCFASSRLHSLPRLDAARTNPCLYRPLATQFFWIFVVVCVLLGWLGGKPPEGIYVIVGGVLTFAYFSYFLVVVPILTRA